MHRKLYLASDSPRRRELLDEAGYVFQVISPGDAESARHEGEGPPDYVARMALQKAAHVAATIHDGVVLGCDTVAECQGLVLGKPVDVADARRILELLSGREHRVYSGLCLWLVPEGRQVVQVDETRLRMHDLSPPQLDEYLAGGQWAGKAGAFGYQDRLGWLDIVSGSETNVVGLPMERLRDMLRTEGIEVEMRVR